MDEFTHVQEAKSKTGRFVLIVALIAVVVFLALLGWGKDNKLTEAQALSRAPALALTEEELRQIVGFACTAAGLSTTRHGGISSVPTLEEIENWRG